MEIVLSEASAEALNRVEGMRRWHVGPTMTRGSKNNPDDLPKAMSTDKQDAKPKAKAATRSKFSKLSSKKSKKQKKAAQADAPVDLDFGETAFGRKNPGRFASMRAMVEEILRLDEQAYGSIPLFTKDGGQCRMKFEGSHLVTLTDFKEQCAHALDTMFLARKCV